MDYTGGGHRAEAANLATVHLSSKRLGRCGDAGQGEAWTRGREGDKESETERARVILAAATKATAAAVSALNMTYDRYVMQHKNAITLCVLPTEAPYNMTYECCTFRLPRLCPSVVRRPSVRRPPFVRSSQRLPLTASSKQFCFPLLPSHWSLLLCYFAPPPPHATVSF